MCIACPAKVLKVDENYLEIIDVVGRNRKVKSVIDAKPGDLVLIGMGYAMQKIDQEQYDNIAKAYEKTL